MSLGNLYGIGVGPGPVEYLTLRAAELLREVDIIFTVAGPKTKSSISKSIVEELGGVRGEVRELTFAMSRDNDLRQRTIEANAQIIFDAINSGKNCAFATIGDPMTYSTFGPIMRMAQEQLPDVTIEVVPGVTSFAALAARSCEVLVEDQEELRIIPGFDKNKIEDITFEEGTTTTILKLYKNRDRMIDRLDSEPISSALYGGRVGLKEELITKDMDFLKKCKEEYLAMMVVKS